MSEDTYNLRVNTELQRQEAAQVEFKYWHEKLRPSMLLRPRVFRDGDQWCALYGKDLQNGVAAFGDSPSEACEKFDKVWRQSTRQIRHGECL